MDFYETQNKYRKKKLKSISSFLLKLLILFFAIFLGWRIGASDKETLLLENQNLSKKFENIKLDLEQKLISTKMKLKEANNALAIKNIREGSNYGMDAKNVLSTALALGIEEKIIIEHLRLLTNKKKCQSYDQKELALSTQNFIPPNRTLILLGGSLRINGQGSSIDKTIDKPFFDPKKPILLTLMYFGGQEIVEKTLPIKKNIMANKFIIKLHIIESNLRGSVIVKYKVCKS